MSYDTAFPVGAGACAIALMLALGRVFWTRRVWELRARLLELLARASDRGLALPALFAHAAAEQKGRMKQRLARVGERLSSGDALSVACAAGGRELFPRHVLGAMRATEGTSALPQTLAAAAHDTEGVLAMRHRIVLAAVYPALLGVFLYCIASFGGRFFEVGAVLGVGVQDTSFIGTVLTALLVAFGGWFVLDRIGLWPTSRLLAGERFLRALGPLVGAGRPLPEAFRLAADAAAGSRLARRARKAADRLDGGTAYEAVCPRLGLPTLVAGRLAAAGNREPVAYARRVEELAEECARRHRARNERVLAWIHPTALVVFGALAAVQYHAVMAFLESVRGVVAPW